MVENVFGGVAERQYERRTAVRATPESDGFRLRESRALRGSDFILHLEGRPISPQIHCAQLVYSDVHQISPQSFSIGVGRGFITMKAR